MPRPIPHTQPTPNSPRATPARRAAAIFLLATAIALLPACSLWPTKPSALAISPVGNEPLRLRGSFDRAFYDFDDQNHVTVLLLAGPEDAPGSTPDQAAVLRMLWKPKAGQTPLAPAATNATIHYLIFADANTAAGPLQEVGVYAGAGFLYLEGTPGTARLTGSLWDADLALIDRSDRFNDLLGPSELEGSFTARRDRTRVRTALRKLATETSSRLGYPRLVSAE
ncbi:MAG: hypothetical protein AAF797_16600 [Planctomycetota bacterium]